VQKEESQGETSSSNAGSLLLIINHHSVMKPSQHVADASAPKSPASTESHPMYTSPLLVISLVACIPCL